VRLIAASSAAGFTFVVCFLVSSPYPDNLRRDPPALQGSMSDRVTAVATTSSPSTEANTFAWGWRGTPIPVGYEVSGPAGAEPT
jgi:hypothetical protein